MGSRYFFDLDSIKPQPGNHGGSITTVTSKETPGLVNMAFSRLILNPGGSLEPIWHPNAHKIGFCVAGKIFITIQTASRTDTFTVKQGEIFFIPQGSVHHMENMSETDSIVHFALNNTLPETMCLSKAIYSISDNVFNQTFNTQTSFADKLKHNKNESLIKKLTKPSQSYAETTTDYKFNIEASTKPIISKGGYLQNGTKANLPALQGLGLLSFGLNLKGVVEPHWHTNAGELVFIVKGKTHITILDPDGFVETLIVHAGQGAFAPASHFHNIENIGTEDVQVIAFFNHAEPDYIGIGEVFGSYSNELLGSIFNVDPSYFESFKKPDKPLVIVPT